MSFIAGTGKTNVDILYAGLKRLPQLGEELYSTVSSCVSAEESPVQW